MWWIAGKDAQKLEISTSKSVIFSPPYGATNNRDAQEPTVARNEWEGCQAGYGTIYNPSGMRPNYVG